VSYNTAMIASFRAARYPALFIIVADRMASTCFGFNHAVAFESLSESELSLDRPSF
jgi:hypothetical protein